MQGVEEMEMAGDLGAIGDELVPGILMHLQAMTKNRQGCRKVPLEVRSKEARLACFRHVFRDAGSESTLQKCIRL